MNLCKSSMQVWAWSDCRMQCSPATTSINLSRHFSVLFPLPNESSFGSCSFQQVKVPTKVPLVSLVVTKENIIYRVRNCAINGYCAMQIGKVCPAREIPTGSRRLAKRPRTLLISRYEPSCCTCWI